MPFVATDLVALVQANAFTLWHYRTADTRTQATAPGYFGADSARFRPGDIMILQASDALAFVPFRANATTGPALTLDGSVAPISLSRSVAFPMRVTQAVSAVVRTIVLAPIVAGVLAGSTIPVEARVAGPIAQVVVTVRAPDGSVIPPARTVTVDQGYANVAVPAPPVGTGYRIRVEDANDPEIAATSATFSVLPDFRLLLQEDAFRILQEDGGRLGQN